MTRLKQRLALYKRRPIWRRAMIVVAVGLLLIPGISLGLAVLLDPQEEETLRLAAIASLTLDQAIVLAKDVATGAVIEGELRMRQSRTVSVIEMLGDRGRFRRIAVDAETGRVIAAEER